VTSRRHRLVKELFLEVLEQPAAERVCYLEKLCEGNAALLAELRSLLGFHEDTTEESPPGASGDPETEATLVATAPESRSREQIPDHRIVQKVGEGGMGEVWEAEQLRPVRRRVAVKVIKAGMDSRNVVARFESERQALALMDHPNIARVFAAGTTDRGRPFFSMEYVSGEPITAYCDRRRLDTVARLDLFIQVCAGVQHAHQKGIIHRDIKPSNVLVRVLDDNPVPTIIDFGIAKAMQQRLTEKTLYTATGMLIGTPEYMSPEQAELTGVDIDTRSDVYSLGVVLYELLVGTLPFDPRATPGIGFDEIRRRIREDEPSKPSTKVTTLGEITAENARHRRTDPSGLRRQLRGDLDWIAMKALEKDRTRRYSSPSELALDIERHLRHEPVSAGPPSTFYRAGKFVRRHRVGVALGLTLIVLLFAGVLGTTAGFLKARREARTARQVSTLVLGIFDDLRPGAMGGGTPSPRELLDRGVQRVESDLAEQPLVQAEVMLMMGRAYGGLGHYESAILLFEKSAEIRREHLGESDPAHALSISFLADTLVEIGEYERARELHEKALAVRREALGPDSLPVSWSLRSLGWMYWRTGNLDEPRPLFEQALEIEEEILGPEHLEVSDTLFMLALVDLDTLNYDGARSRFERVLQIRESQLGPDTAAVAVTLTQLGRIHRENGELEQALPLFEQSLATLEKVFGPEHRELAVPLQNIGRLLITTGDLDGARGRLDRALRIQEQSVGPDHPDLAWSLEAQGRLYRRTGELEAARASYRRALAILERAFGDGHVDTARTLSSLGYLEYETGDYEEATDLMNRSLGAYLNLYGTDHLAVAGVRYNLACLAALRNDTDGALELLRQALESGFSRPVIFDDEDLRSLRGDPRFDEIVAVVRDRQP
jgi:non-specific serine/threonine protein kinase/serine/threonine-protein kinase